MNTEPSDPGGGSRYRLDGTDLPVGSDDSPYLFAGWVPPGTLLVDARDEELKKPPTPTHTIRYRMVSQSADPADAPGFELQTIETRQSFFDRIKGASPSELEGVSWTRVRGHRAVRYPLTDDGKAFGTVVAWEERPRLWVTLSVEDRFGTQHARRIAESLEPLAPRTWADLKTGLDPSWGVEGPLIKQLREPHDAVELGTGTAGGVTWTLDALVPKRFREVPIERRRPCVRVRTADDPVGSFSCWSTPSTMSVGGREYLVGTADPGTTSVRVTGGRKPVDAVLYRDDRAGDRTYWIAPLGTNPCGLLVLEIQPSDPSHPENRRVDGDPVGPAGRSCDGTPITEPEPRLGGDPASDPPRPTTGVVPQVPSAPTSTRPAGATPSGN